MLPFARHYPTCILVRASVKDGAPDAEFVTGEIASRMPARRSRFVPVIVLVDSGDRSRPYSCSAPNAGQPLDQVPTYASTTPSETMRITNTLRADTSSMPAASVPDRLMRPRGA